MEAKTLKLLSRLCMAAGTASIGASMATWVLNRERKDEFGRQLSLFVGLWPPTFFALADRLSLAALEKEEEYALSGHRVEEEEARVQSPRPLSYVRR